jgi:uncharacterized protein (TIGR03790 family)
MEKKRLPPGLLWPLLICLLATVFLLIGSSVAIALNPEDLLVVTNRAVAEGAQLARYYMSARHVPSANLIELDTSKGEDVSREDYDKEIASPVRRFLSENDPQGKRFRCILLMYGVPLRVGPPAMTGEEKRLLLELQERKAELESEIEAAEKQDQKAIKTLRDEQGEIGKKIEKVAKYSYVASVDSEIALVMERHYPLEGWVLNRYFAGFRGRDMGNLPQRVLLVSRLDGPTEAVVRRIVDDSIWAEERGLSGKAYFDARWTDKENQDPSAYHAYDREIHNAAALVAKSKKLPVVLDERARLFQPGEAPDAALYCGWYSLAKYVDAFTWVRGAVGFHVASSECVSLRGNRTQLWCRAMLERGVAATLGPVGEPYLQAFPSPEIFFASLIEGRLTLAECYAISVPFWSWRMVLIGDPLYRPFKARFGGTDGTGEKTR